MARSCDLAWTPSQTVGPFFGFALAWMAGGELARPGDAGALVLAGQVRDGADQPVPDAVVEIWQADRHGHFGPEAEAGWSGFGRVLSDGDGRFTFVTVKPGGVRYTDGIASAPHIAMSVFARGLLQRLVTRVYFPDEVETNSTDPVLCSIDDPDARATLVASHSDGQLRFDVRLQGPGETVFFAY